MFEKLHNQKNMMSASNTPGSLLEFKQKQVKPQSTRNLFGTNFSNMNANYQFNSNGTVSLTPPNPM